MPEANIPTLRPSSWNELNTALYADRATTRVDRVRTTLAFRGAATVEDNLATQLERLGSPSERVEHHLLRDLRKYAAGSDLAKGDQVWNWMALGQHHGLPTRLLDWTYSPFVALHFVTADERLFDQDGLIWSVDYHKTNRYLPDRLTDLLRSEDVGVFTAEMLTQAAPTLREFDRLAPEQFVVLFEPPSLDARISNQFALFALMSSPTANLGCWLQRRRGLARRIIIPAELKWHVRDKLDQANITERVLFPGLDGLSRWLRRYYGPRQRASVAPEAPLARARTPVLRRPRRGRPAGVSGRG